MPNQAPQLESQRAADMADVFISYSRKDIEFAQRIHQELEASQRLETLGQLAGYPSHRMVG